MQSAIQREAALSLLPKGTTCKAVGRIYTVRLPDGKAIAREGNAPAAWQAARTWATLNTEQFVEAAQASEIQYAN